MCREVDIKNMPILAVDIFITQEHTSDGSGVVVGVYDCKYLR